MLLNSQKFPFEHSKHSCVKQTDMQIGINTVESDVDAGIRYNQGRATAEPSDKARGSFEKI